ncbi:MAG: hypothetical protein K2M51_04165 [Helicobacter sp.]|nr:hypothetical protein [Helicobacter sp.]MDE7196897.1 hypothetical protein [Helicobacter sp.]MDE7448222.1 hypothetical protein [Helicobacter sp.]
MQTRILCLSVLVLFFCACEYQRKITAAEIGCRKEYIIFPEGETQLAGNLPDYWIARCGNREFSCTRFYYTVFSEPTAKCSEILPQQPYQQPYQQQYQQPYQQPQQQYQQPQQSYPQQYQRY